MLNLKRFRWSCGRADSPKRLADASLILESLRARQNDGVGLPSTGGWVYMINDTNQFLDWQFGLLEWTQTEKQRVAGMLKVRHDYFSRLGIPYLMLVTPEKSVAYREWLPTEFSQMIENKTRPALYIAEKFESTIKYPAAELEAAKRYGLLYFRGDSHVNWLGAFHLYHYLISVLHNLGVNIGTALPFSYLLPSLAGWQGDLLVQIPPARIAEFEADVALWRPSVMDEILLQFNLNPEKRHSRRLEVPDIFQRGKPERETVVTVNHDASLPTALIFRDSTATLMIDLLAEHFSRAVFVWHDADVIESLVDHEKPDIVLHMKAERFISSYTAVPPFTSGVNPMTGEIAAPSRVGSR